MAIYTDKSSAARTNQVNGSSLVDLEAGQVSREIFVSDEIYQQELE